MTLFDSDTGQSAAPTEAPQGGGRMQGTGLPISGGLLAIVFAGALLMLRQEALNPTRPSMAVPSSVDAQIETVQARLWQDPFAAVAQHQEGGGNGERYPGWFEAGPKEARERQPLRVLAVMVSAGPYDEQAERRLRSRHAVLSALGEEGYVPEDSEHIGYFRHDLSAEVECTGSEEAVAGGAPFAFRQPSSSLEAQATDKSVEIDIPYEWLTSRRDAPRLLLLWLNEGAFQVKPLTRLGALVNALRCGEPGAELTLLGPYGSTTLLAMAEQMDECLDARRPGCEETGRQLRGIQLLSPSATISKTLLGRQQSAAEALDRQFLDRQFKKLTGNDESRFLRTTSTDRDLADSLIDELVRRGVDPRCWFDQKTQTTRSLEQCNSDGADPKPAHIALVSEWDTHYGRALPCAFVASATLGRYPEDCRGVLAPRSAEGVELDWLHRFSYLRGFDGQLPKTEEDAAKSEGRASDAESVRSSPAERPVGRRRLDYLQRLTAQLLRLDGELRRANGGTGLEAIGVLGSDVYDKLLILQALREEFQHILFFTTDLDASLLHPAEYKAARNLIVVSNFGLELHEDLQGKIPPFRDGYQTSLFRSARLALDPDLQKYAIDPPRIYEIGRRGAFDLSEDTGTRSAHPPRADHLVRGFSPRAKWILPGIGALIVLFSFVYWRSYRPSRQSASKLRIRLTTGSLLLAGVTTLAILICTQQWDGEPFALFDGISVWPSLYLRFLAAVLSLHFLLMSWRSIAQSDADLERNFLPRAAGGKARRERKRRIWRGLRRLTRLYFHRFYRHGPASATSGAVADTSWVQTAQGIRLPIITSDLDAPIATARQLLRTYLHRSRLSRRLLRVLPLSLVYYVVCGSFIGLTGRPNVPFRGFWSYLVSEMTTRWLAVPLLILLIFWVVDATRLSGRLTAELSSCRTRWPKATLEHFGARLNLIPELVGEWLDIQVIARHSAAIGRLVYAPVIVIVLMIASRAAYVDNWAFPPGLSVVICLSVLYSVYCGATVRRSAEHARSAALRRYHSALIQSEGADSEQSSAQIRLLIDEIANLRVGVFVPFGQQPWVRAIALLFGGGGSLVLLEYLMLAR